jgi:hypothetical protein
MEKQRFKITLNWQGEVHTIYRHAASAPQALCHAIRELARKVGYSNEFVKKYVMEDVYDRWRVEIK